MVNDCTKSSFMWTVKEDLHCWTISRNWSRAQVKTAENKIRDYVKALAVNGTYLPETYAKHLDGQIWELRPVNDRILFAGYFNGAFILLHCFVKKTQKTPVREIQKAKRELADFIEREGNI